MASFLNKVMIIGNVTKDPVVKNVSNNGEDNKVANFTVATNRIWKDKAGKEQTEAQFTPVVLWRNLAELTEKYVKQGKKVYIEGHIKTRSYEDKEGVTRYVTEVIGESLIFLGANGQQEDAEAVTASEPVAKATPAKVAPKSDEKEIEDIPF